MKKFLFIFIVFPALLRAQSIPQALISLSTLTNLRAEIPQTNEMVTLLGLNSLNDGNGGTYYWNSTSTATDDGFITVAVTGISTGRWIRLANSNTLKGTVTLS